MKLETLKDLLIEQMQDIYDAEHQLTEALPKMKRSAHSPDLKQAFEDHLGQTEGHIQRLEQVFQALGEPAKRKTCKAMKGLVKEGEEMIEEEADRDVKDAGLIAAAQRVEHYEIAGYGTLMAYAKQVGERGIIDLLSQTLQEEKDADEKLTVLAESSINVKANQ